MIVQPRTRRIGLAVAMIALLSGGCASRETVSPETDAGTTTAGVVEFRANNIDGRPVADAGKLDQLVSFDILVPKGLGEPAGLWVSDDTVAFEDRAVEFDYKMPEGLVIVVEYPPQFPVDEWESTIQDIISTNGDPDTHGSAQMAKIRNGDLALVTVSEDKDASAVEWYESPNLMVRVASDDVDTNGVVAIADSM